MPQRPTLKKQFFDLEGKNAQESSKTQKLILEESFSFVINVGT